MSISSVYLPALQKRKILLTMKMINARPNSGILIPAGGMPIFMTAILIRVIISLSIVTAAVWNLNWQLAEIAEEVFDELVTEFLITSIEDELQFTEDYTYYIYAEKYIDPIQAMGFRNGFFIGAIDCVTIPNYHLIYRYRSIVKHELTHVFQFTLTDCPKNSLCPEWLGFWFREGQAHLMSDAGDDTYITYT